MISTALEYAKRLRELNIPGDIVGQTGDIFKAVPQVKLDFESPAVSLSAKHNVIEKVFPLQIRDFLKVLCDNGDVYLWDDICTAYREVSPEKKEEFVVTLSYVTAPTDEQLQNIRNFIQKKYNREDMVFETKEDPSLGGGFIIRAGNEVYDWSTNGRMKQFADKLSQVGKTASEQGIISILKGEIEDFNLQAQENEIGSVSWVGDGIANVNGIDHAEYGEIVIFDSGVKGMVQDVRRDEIGCILFGHDTEIREGTRVVRTGKRAGIPVGDGFKGRIVDALGAPIDGAGPIKEEGYRPIEQPAPSIVDRQSVGVPMETGILAIDSMFPIGRGQRELIIGDRQTGKTSIATDAILNQKDKDVLCIYVAIGQKASSIARVAEDLKKHGAMSYTTIVAATASDSAPLQYIAPYAGTALAEYFMAKGKSVLIVYDDLSKHAVAYRAISLLLRRSPGREAYPGDVFYLHSRLLERSCRMRDDLGGGSITALPIVETQAGDVSAYIPTNVISITDGQIFLESALFNAGNRPAVNVGLSVSRVGGAAQTKAMKKANANLRIELAQYKEMESFAQFSSDLDAETRRQLEHGKALMEMLKQPLCQPKSDAEQVVILVLASHGLLDTLPTAEQREKTAAFVRQFRADVSGTMQKIDADGKLEPDRVDAILNAWKAYAGGNDHVVQ